MSFNLYHNLPELARKGGFSLCDGSDEKDDTIDWRFIASIDPSRIIRESNFEKLDECIPFLIRSSVGNLLNVRILDPSIARIYIVSQLSLQYLLFCIKFLDKSVYSLRENLYNFQKKNVKVEDELQKRDEEIVQLQKKLKRQEVLNQQVFPCMKCTKNFLSAALLDNHVQRKHPSVQQQESKDKDSNLINTIKLELEIKQLKERLNVTEKELMEANSKRANVMECPKCLLNAQKRFVSIAVQSNFEEKEKDDIEKDEVHQLLTNQMRYFEEWKRNEELQKRNDELRYRDEINELRSKLDETIEVLRSGSQKEQPPPSPAPRLLTLSEKAVGTSKSVESLAEKKIEDEWKTRYQEMEKMYESNQQRMSSTVNSIEKTYNEKITQLEETMKNMKVEQTKAKEHVKRREAETSANCEMPLSPKVIKRTIIEDYSSLSSSESEIAMKESPKIDHVVEKDQKPTANSEEILVIKPAKPSFAAQKFLLQPKKSVPEKKRELIPPRNAREEAELLFNKRLNLLGVPKSNDRMSRAEFDRVHSQMANMRDESKKKNRSFFITRKKLQSKVEKIFQQKCKSKPPEQDENALGNVGEKKSEKEKTKVFAASFKSALPQESQISGFSFERPALVEVIPKDNLKQTFRDDLEKLLEKRLPTALSSRELEPVFETHAPAKKKVLFDLKSFDEPKKFEDIREVVEEDDSDFEISSFASEETR